MGVSNKFRVILIMTHFLMKIFLLPSFSITGIRPADAFICSENINFTFSQFIWKLIFIFRRAPAPNWARFFSCRFKIFYRFSCKKILHTWHSGRTTVVLQKLTVQKLTHFFKILDVTHFWPKCISFWTTPVSSKTHPVLLLKSMFLDCIGFYCLFALLRFKSGKIGGYGNSRSKPCLLCKFVIKIRYFEKYQIVIERMFSKSFFVSRWDFTRSNVRMKNNSFWNHFKLGVWSICWFISEILYYRYKNYTIILICTINFTFWIRQWWFWYF